MDIKYYQKKKNKKLFELTKNGFGLTGIIIELKFKVFNLTCSNYKINIININNLYECYKFLKKSKNDFNQNSFYVDYDKEKIFRGRIVVGEKVYTNIKPRILKLNKISRTRLKLLNFKILKKILFTGVFYFEKFKNFVSNKTDINKLIFTSNYNTLYFLFQSNKFIEYQNIIPENKIKKYLFELENLLIKYKPNISLVHLKIFNKYGKGFEFSNKGLALALHIIDNKNFNIFTKQLLKLDLKYKCKINLYKNSLINKKIVEMFYPSHTKRFLKNIDSINKKYKFINRIFR